MAKSTNSNKTENAPQRKKKKAPKKNYRQMIISALIILALIAFILPDLLPLFTGSSRGGAVTPSSIPNTSNSPSTMPEPTFIKEGTLTLINGETGAAIKQIDIEKAENDQERTIGMMFRKSMPDNQGMFFLFDESKPQSFWMKNTLIPLDILFIDENKKINTIHPNATPHSEASLPSNGNARYVLEVRGGFCQDYGVKVGDIVNWE